MISPKTEQALDSRFAKSDRLPTRQITCDGIPTFWIESDDLIETLGHLKSGTEQPYPLLYDLTAIDERERQERSGQPPSDFTVVYHLFSFERNEFIRLKVALCGEYPSLPSITSVWAMADWYECEVWDMFGIRFQGHPRLRRILMPKTWEGHPLLK